MNIELQIKEIAPHFSKEILLAAKSSHNEAEFRTKAARLIEDFAEKVRLTIPVREEYTLINGRADAVYNRLIIEYEPPGSLKPNNSNRANQHAINQIKNYIEGLARRERHRPERIVGVVLDGNYFIFIRKKEGVYHIDNPLRVDSSSTELFLSLLCSLSTELALIPENLVRDFGENTTISRNVVSSLYNALTTSTNPKVKTLFEQWSLQFSEACDYSEASKVDVRTFARNFGINDERPDSFKVFFCIHTYYATFIKLLALLIVHYYLMPKLGTDLKKAATQSIEELRAYMKKIEEGGLFRELGISNFLEGDFFSWYLETWNNDIYNAIKSLISQLSKYSLITLDVDPEETRDLLKKLYQNLMPKKIRHNLGEYYTPDWLAERLLGMLCGWRKDGEIRVPDIRPDYRILDPACGSGTFLVLSIKYARQYAKEKMLPETEVLEKILNNIVGFDLNPLAVISARTNYLLALGDLLQHRKGDINVPVYICDSILTPHEGEDLFGKDIMRFNTAVGPFMLPKSLVNAQYIDKLANFLEDSVKLGLDRKQFISKLTDSFPLIEEKDSRDIEVVYNLYEKLLTLEKQGINGIWARIIKNAFAPLFVGEFDYVAGNPPWVNWEHLPEGYRRDTLKLWHRYGLIPPRGIRAILGESKMDISALMTYVSLDKYLKIRGKLGFVITQSVFKTVAGKGFRQFLLVKDNLPIRVIHVDDMVKLNPFKDASNRSSIVILQKGIPTKYPIKSYLYWKKLNLGKSLSTNSKLEDVLAMTERKQFVAEPVNINDFTSSWITGKPKAVKAIRKIIGQSDYIAHEGVNSGGANAVYWVNIVDKRPDGLIVVSNITEGAKRKVENVQIAIEPDLLYSLLRENEIKKWQTRSNAYIIMTRTPEFINQKAIPENIMKTFYPKTFLYFSRFKKPLLDRKDSVLQRSLRYIPFYSLAAVNNYTFLPFKVVWTRMAKIEAAVVSNKNGKPIIPQETISYVPLHNKQEAYYVAGMINSSPFQYAAISYSQEGGKSMGSPHILENIRIPKFNPENNLHLRLAELSQKAHEETAKGNDVSEIEEEIDLLTAKIWGLTDDELKDIKKSLEELR